MVCLCGVGCVWFVSGLYCEVVCMLRVFVPVVTCVCFVYVVPCGVVSCVCLCLSLCVWLFAVDMKCLAAVFVSFCAMMCDGVWPVCLCLFVLCVICCWRF